MNQVTTLIIDPARTITAQLGLLRASTHLSAIHFLLSLSLSFSVFTALFVNYTLFFLHACFTSHVILVFFFFWLLYLLALCFSSFFLFFFSSFLSSSSSSSDRRLSFRNETLLLEGHFFCCSLKKKKKTSLCIYVKFQRTAPDR